MAKERLRDRRRSKSADSTEPIREMPVYHLFKHPITGQEVSVWFLNSNGQYTSFTLPVGDNDKDDNERRSNSFYAQYLVDVKNGAEIVK